MLLISQGDIIDLFLKTKERGRNYLLTKLHLNYDTIVKSTWAEQYGSYNWLDIPRVRERINRLITGDPMTDYPAYIMRKFFTAKHDLKMLSLGCGAGFREVEFAKNAKFALIDALDIARNRIATAIKCAEENQIHTINFIVADAYSYDLKKEYYDVILCQSFLHHCRHLEGLMKKLRSSLKPDGILVVHDYVGPKRFQWQKEQLRLVNQILAQIPSRYKVRSFSNTLKSKVYLPGILRMLLSDPSEAVESREIIPMIYQNFRVVEEKNLGGSILLLLFKDIAQNFLSTDNKTNGLLDRIFDAENKFLEQGHKSDFIFGIYRVGP